MTRFAVAGAGGVGGLVAALLGHAGHEVAVLARGRTLDALRARGLLLRRPSRELHVTVRASDRAEELGVVDVVLVAVKAWQVAELAPRLSSLLQPTTVVIPLQNGLDAADLLGAALGAEHVVSGLCHMISWVEEPGVIRDGGPPPAITLGANAELAAMLTAAGLATRVVADLDSALWEKLLFLAPFATVGAVARQPVGVVRANPTLRGWLREAMQEIEALARLRKVALSDDVVERALGRVDALPAEATASLQRDVLAGRPSELHELTGAILRRAQESLVAVPRNTALFEALVPLERAARAHSTG